MRRGNIFSNSICIVFIAASICCSFVVIITTLKLPEISLGRPFSKIDSNVFRDEELGKFGEIMLGMLAEDLAFTIFVPSEKAFERDLRLRVNHDLEGDKMNNTYAILSRIVGFSAIPRPLASVKVASDEETSYDSLSGFTLYISKGTDGMLVVNRIRSERVDIKKGKIIAHIMDGVIMDAEFEQSVLPDYNEREE